MGAFLTRELPSELPAGLSAFRQTSACMGRFTGKIDLKAPTDSEIMSLKILF
jgi:hypothetical protein